MSAGENNALFGGSIPENYDRYLGPMFFEPYASSIAEWIEPEKVEIALELACGTGRVTAHLRRNLRAQARLIASDISEDMLAVARKRVGDVDVEWRIINAMDLPFADKTVDLIVCFFGYMFVPDRSKAFAEAFRILRPDGSLIIATWDSLEQNKASQIFRSAVKKYFGDPLPETYALPFSMSDPALIRKHLMDAGFDKVDVALVARMAKANSAAAAAEGLLKGGALYHEITKRNPAWVEEIRGIVEASLAEKYGNAPMQAPMKAIIARGIK